MAWAGNIFGQKPPARIFRSCLMEAMLVQGMCDAYRIFNFSAVRKGCERTSNKFKSCYPVMELVCHRDDYFSEPQDSRLAAASMRNSLVFENDVGQKNAANETNFVDVLDQART
jgi:UDP-N-acetyl-D-mannosaminuronic acid transferase (WecB/TagA/CpsF family)